MFRGGVEGSSYVPPIVGRDGEETEEAVCAAHYECRYR